MTNQKPYMVSPGWLLMFRDVGLETSNVLRRANLPEDLFTRTRATLSSSDYFRLWRAVDEEAGDPTLPIKFAKVMSAETFIPPVFAALCSPNLNVGFARLAKYKQLVADKVLDLDITDESTSVACRWLDKTVQPPEVLVFVELVFCVALVRLATRERICPIEVRAPMLPKERDAYSEYFGVVVRKGDVPSVRFSSSDARRPFLTANDSMWKFFEKELNQRLADLTDSATAEDKVHAALLELLPAGGATMEAVSQRLGVSPRTLHRRLKAEHSTFQRVLDQTREALARHYLKSSSMTGAEISFLLGYEDPNSFSRAFNGWTGTTPESARREIVGESA